ncbi:hypothetical protein [Ensifer aridi]|nr:hypothetical protein [Ensifer aridi]
MAVDSGTSTNGLTDPVIGSAYEGMYHAMTFGLIGNYIFALE